MSEEPSAQAASRAIAQVGRTTRRRLIKRGRREQAFPTRRRIASTPPKEAPPEERGPQRRSQAAARQASIEGMEKVQVFPLAVAPPRRSPFTTYILVEAIQLGIKISNISEYDGMKDPQDHLDQFLAKADLLDISDAAYYSFEQLSQRFLHHFAINKRDPKTASYLFTVTQREHESLREYVQRFSEAVLEVPHVNQELLASIMQQNLRMGRFHESIARKPPATLDEL
ncbi:UNVERIFIED_CONTAM: hypothetical protein Scaly_2963300 [Sesamum calycinum]|uniref:Retrotransposon gag domain-containing protein n=1 Tax=Sesamum calycinum TaxID=2727403 RepID=A0AAW2KMX1_9LAMI